MTTPHRMPKTPVRPERTPDAPQAQQLSLLLDADDTPAALQHQTPAAITPVVVCSGSGDSLWPLSRRSQPEPFVRVSGTPSLIEQTLERLAQFGPPARSVLCVVPDEHRFMALEALKTAGVAGRLLLEPQARGSAAAMALAALSSPPDALLLVCPAHLHLPDSSTFVHDVQRGVAAARSGAIVCLGLPAGAGGPVAGPGDTRGYLETGAPRTDGSLQVTRFVPQPSASKARRLQQQSGVFAHLGLYLASADTLVQALAQHAPDILRACQAAMAAAGRGTVPAGEHAVYFVRPHARHYLDCRAQSFEQAVVHDHKDLALVPLEGRWTEVAHWGAVAALTKADAGGNSVLGQGHTLHTRHTFVHAPHRPVLALGTQDLIIVDTADAVLVAHRDQAPRLADAVAELENTGHRLGTTATTHKTGQPWGWRHSVHQGERHVVQRLGIKPGASTPLQKHHHRAEHWIVVKGIAQITCGERTLLLSENQSTWIPAGEPYRLHNPGRLELELLEVQSGHYLGADDVVSLPESPALPPAAAEPDSAPAGFGNGLAPLREAPPTDHGFSSPSMTALRSAQR